MNTHYTNEKNTQIVLSLLKAHGIKKVIASPGTTNIRLVASMQQDEWFEMYSAADERSAAYIACGLAAESGEPVVLSCTGATASRNYIPGLTEAFYRKLPILAITSTQYLGKVGQNVAQVIDRAKQQSDIVRLSVQLPTCRCEDDEWACNVQANRAILELTRCGGGPVHINLETTYSGDFSVEKLPYVRAIYRIDTKTQFPKIPEGKIGIFVGNHKTWSDDLTCAVDKFCGAYDAVVLCDHTSNYHGKYRVLSNLVTSQDHCRPQCCNFDLIIHIGDVSGAYPAFKSAVQWRVNPDGEIRDTFRHLEYVFEMDECYFFEKYVSDRTDASFTESLEVWEKEDKRIRESIQELPFSNIWIAQHTAPLISAGSVLHLGILNSLRAWNFFEISNEVEVRCNTGGFGIDGIISSAIGASLATPDKTVFCVIGDLAFFYDMNSLGNHHVGKNLRILLVNNGCGTEFKNYNHPGAQFGEDANAFVAAAGHYGAKSRNLVKHYAEDLGLRYMSAESKEEYLNKIDDFVNPGMADSSVIFEVFTNSDDESEALKRIRNAVVGSDYIIKSGVKNAVKGIVGQTGYNALKKLAGKK